MMHETASELQVATGDNRELDHTGELHVSEVCACAGAIKHERGVRSTKRGVARKLHLSITELCAAPLQSAHNLRGLPGHAH